MKKGDVVKIWDSSYSKVVTEHGLKDGYDITRGKQGVIVEVDYKLPNPHKNQQYYGNHFNNTIIITNSGKVVFIEERFLRSVLPKHKVMVDLVFYPGYGTGGDMVEISDKLYKKIKRGS